MKKGVLLRRSPIKTLAELYASDGRASEARQLLYGPLDLVKQHPVVKGYFGTPSSCSNGNQCISCHRDEKPNKEFAGFYDFIQMSGAMTDLGYPVDSLVALAKTDASFRNAFVSGPKWVDTGSEVTNRWWAGWLDTEKTYTKGFRFAEQKREAIKKLTPRAVIDALGRDTFHRSPNYQAGEIDLMLSLRGTGEQAVPTVYSPVIDILKSALDAAGPQADKDIAELDEKLVKLSATEAGGIETGIAATVFAFLRNDLDSAKDRLKRLHVITDYPASVGVAFWLVAQHALQYDQTRILGAVLAERALAAAEVQPDSGFKEAILRERSGLRTK